MGILLYAGGCAMTLTLAPNEEQFIEEKIRSGEYASREEVLRAALATLMDQDQLARLSMDELETVFPDFRKKIQEGLAQADAGLLTDGDEFFDELERQDP
jgi:antitoxin ParD1/3/4